MMRAVHVAGVIIGVLLAVCGETTARAQVPSAVTKLLPEGSEVAPTADTSGVHRGAVATSELAESLPRRDAVITKDLAGDQGERFVLFFVREARLDFVLPRAEPLLIGNGAGFVVVKRDGSRFVKEFEYVDPAVTEVSAFSGVRDIVGDGRPTIVFLGVMSPAAGVKLSLFRWHGGAYQRVGIDASERYYVVEIRDYDGNAINELSVGSLPIRHGDLPQVFRWNGREYVEATDAFPEAYDAFIRENREAFEQTPDAPWTARIEWGQNALSGLVRQRHFAEALSLSAELLRVIDGVELRAPGAAPALRGGRGVVVATEPIADTVARLKGELHLVRGDVLWAQGRATDARQAFQRAEALTPSATAAARARLHVLAAEDFRRAGRLDEAVRELQEALRYGPNYGEGYARLAETHRTRGALEQGLAVLKRYREVESRRVERCRTYRRLDLAPSASLDRGFVEEVKRQCG